MNCEILETLYLRSNGDVPCNDDAGENTLLGMVRLQREGRTINSLLQNHHYRHIRESLARGVAPWPACSQCAFFRPHQPLSDALAQGRIRKIQVEPSLACRLRCPGCSNHLQSRVRPGPHLMDPALFERVLRSLRDEGYAVGEIEYCGQGEPLLHPEFASFVSLGRRYFPDASQRVITSGNFDFGETVGDAPPDEIMVSCDGAFPESYARYRIGGRLEPVLQFMRDARRRVGTGVREVVWKYILFEWNDSDAELLAAQHLAEDIGLDYLLFVFTHSAGKSRRFDRARAGTLPIVTPRAVVCATPVQYRDDRVAAAVA